MGPDFLCIGGQRCGTTWLHHVLDAAPGVWTPPVKELHHFDVVAGLTPDRFRYRRHLRSRLKHYGRAALRRAGLGGPRAERLAPGWDLRYFSGRRSDDWYASLFGDDVAGARVRGEITPAYSILPEPAIARIAALFPRLKVILILRDPVERAWSAALREPGLDRGDDAALIAHMRSTGCLARSDWAAILTRWGAHVPPERLGVFDFATLRARPQAFLDGVGGFLGVELRAVAAADAPRKRNASTHRKGAAPSHVVEAVMDLYAPLIEAAAEVAPDVARPWAKRWLGSSRAAE